MAILEICCFSLDSCIIAEAHGADRIELCSNPLEGGTTPSYGMIKAARQAVKIPIFPIIRPRGGDFLYNELEFLSIKEDIRFCKSAGCEGIVTGLLLEDGRVDSERLSMLVDLAYPMEVTFHRAFDRAADPFGALELIIKAGCQRILSSGQMPTAEEGLPLLSQLIDAAKDRIVIMPGSGLRSGNIQALADACGAKEFHSSARVAVPSKMNFFNQAMGDDLSTVECDGEEIRKMAGILRSAISIEGEVM